MDDAEFHEYGLEQPPTHFHAPVGNFICETGKRFDADQY